MRLIDADALNEELSSLGMTITGLRAGKGVLNEFMMEYRKSVLQIVEDAPTIEAEPVRHGKWIEKRQMIAWCDDDVDVYYTCSACEADSPCEYPFCPNCGAKMDLKEKDL